MDNHCSLYAQGETQQSDISEEEEAQGDLINSYKYLKGGWKSGRTRAPLTTFQWWPVTDKRQQVKTGK